MTPVMASLAEVLRSSTDYSPCYPWFVRLAKNFHNIQENRDYENCFIFCVENVNIIFLLKIN